MKSKTEAAIALSVLAFVCMVWVFSMFGFSPDPTTNLLTAMLGLVLVCVLSVLFVLGMGIHYLIEDWRETQHEKRDPQAP